LASKIFSATYYGPQLSQRTVNNPGQDVTLASCVAHSYWQNTSWTLSVLYSCKWYFKINFRTHRKHTTYLEATVLVLRCITGYLFPVISG